MRMLWLTLLVAGACTDPAIDIQLALPPPPAQGQPAFDLSCVTAVDIQPIAVGDRKSLDIGQREYDTMDASPCVDLTSPPTSFADIEAQLHGKFDIPVPANGLAALEIRGRAGTCKDMPAFYESVFYGAAPYGGHGSVTIPVKHNISCDQATTYTIRPVDLGQLVQSKTCAPVTSTTGQVSAADVRPTGLGGDFPSVVMEVGAAYTSLANGTGTVNSFKQSYGGTCPAVAWDDNGAVGVTCINAGAPTACGQPGEIELPVVQESLLTNAVDGSQPYAGFVMGVVWSNTAPVGPVQGATVTLDQGAQGAVEYGSGGAQGFTPSATASATDASGMFEVYANEVVGVTVTAPGHGTQRLFVGGDLNSVGSTIAVLP